MSKKWPMVKLGEVLSRTGEIITPDPSREYSEITVKLWGKGVVERGRVSGASVNGKRFVAMAGNFIASRIDARNGAMGLVPESLDGALVTNDFPLFAPNKSRLDLAFLDWLTKTRDFVDLCLRASEGTTNRVRLKEDRFLALEIPLPSLAEQRRIVARIEQLAAQVHEAKRLRKEAAEEAEAMVASECNAIFSGDNAVKWNKVCLVDIAEIRAGVTLGRRLNGETTRLPYLRVANVQDGYLDLTEVKEVEILESEVEKWSLQSGDILLTEGGDWDKLGRGTVWRGEIANCIHQNHIFRVRAHRAIMPEFLSKQIGSPLGKSYFQSASKQTTNLASINQRQLKAFPVLFPSLPEQRRIVAELDALQAEVDGLKRLQAETSAELDALLPAILDRAFKGGL